MDRRQVLGLVGALTLAAVMGVGDAAAEKSKAVKAAKACCCCDTCCCCCPVCCGENCCSESTTASVVDKTVKAANAAKPSCCPVTVAKTADPKVTVDR